MKTYGFGELQDGSKAGLYILKNTSGMQAAVTDYGATLVSLMVPGRDGVNRDVVLGHDDAAGYEFGHGSIGATVGRYANRIGGAMFKIGGRVYELTANNGPNALHGGRDPYRKRLWEAKIPFGKMSSGEIYRAYAVESLNDKWPAGIEENMDGEQMVFCLDSPDGDQGFPGNVHIEVSYTLTGDNELHIDYKAVSDHDTPFNMTNHSYFNLNGHDSGSVLQQFVQIKADKFTASDINLLPTGELRDVAGTPMDFRSPKMLGRDIDADYDQLRYGNGYDHNFVVAEAAGIYREIASMYSEESGIHMTVLTDLPGVQLFTANGMSGEVGKDGTIYSPRCGACFETQFWPDAVNKENFPGGILKAGEVFRSRTTYKFTSK